MKSKFFIGLLLASAISSGFADASTLAQRDQMVKEAFTKDSQKAIEEITKQQQGQSTDQNYVVILEKKDGKYVRVAHFKTDMVGKEVEPDLIKILEDADKLATSANPVAYKFTANAKDSFAAISKQGNYLIFNICPTQEELDNLLKTSTKPAEKEAEKPAETPEKKPEVKVEERPADKPAETPEKKPEVKTEEKPADKPAEKPAEANKDKAAAPATTEAKPDAGKQETPAKPAS